jgi:hypothetical protein
MPAWNHLHRLAENGKSQRIRDAVPGTDRREASLRVHGFLVKREEAFEYPTDCGLMEQREISQIATRGYQLTRTLIAYYCPEL